MHQSISNPPESLDNTYLEKTGVDKYANLASAQEIKELVKKENPDFKKYYHDALYTLTGQKINEKLEKQYIRDFELISRAYIESNHDKKRIIDYFSSGDNQRKLSIFETILSNTKITIEHDERPRLLSYPKFIDRTFHQINALPQKQPQNIKKIIDQNSIIFFNNVSHILDKVGLENNEETKFFITKNFVKDVLSGGFFDYLKDIYHQDMFEINYQNYIPGYDRNEHIERITYLQKQMKRLDKLFIANYQKTKKFQDQRSSLLKEIKNIEKTLAETPEKKQKDSEQELETKKTRLEKIQSDINRRKVKIQHVPVLKEAINLILEHTQYIYLLDHLKGADAFRRQLRTIIETKIGDIDIFNNNPEEPDFETLDSLITSKSHLKQNNAQHLPTILLIYSSGLDNYMESNNPKNYENFQHLLHAFKVNTENIETVYQLAKIKSNFQQVLKDPNRIKDTKEIKIDIEYNLLKNINQIQNLTEKPTLINDTNSILELLSSNDIQQLPKEYQSKFYNLIKYIDSELVRIDNNSFQYQQDESYDRMLKKVDEKTYDQDKVIDLKVKLNVITDLLVYKLTQILSTDYQEKTKDIDKDKDTLLAA